MSICCEVYCDIVRTFLTWHNFLWTLECSASPGINDVRAPIYASRVTTRPGAASKWTLVCGYYISKLTPAGKVGQIHDADGPASRRGGGVAEMRGGRGAQVAPGLPRRPASTANSLTSSSSCQMRSSRSASGLTRTSCTTSPGTSLAACTSESSEACCSIEVAADSITLDIFWSPAHRFGLMC